MFYFPLQLTSQELSAFLHPNDLLLGYVSRGGVVGVFPSSLPILPILWDTRYSVEAHSVLAIFWLLRVVA